MPRFRTDSVQASIRGGLIMSRLPGGAKGNFLAAAYRRAGVAAPAPPAPGPGPEWQQGAAPQGPQRQGVAAGAQRAPQAPAPGWQQGTAPQGPQRQGVAAGAQRGVAPPPQGA